VVPWVKSRLRVQRVKIDSIRVKLSARGPERNSFTKKTALEKASGAFVSTP
jgi:hypothetical protein